MQIVNPLCPEDIVCILSNPPSYVNLMKSHAESRLRARTLNGMICVMENARRRGQAALEYILVFVALLGLVFALGFLVRAARSSSERTATLVSAEYP